ncbi:uncharacterized protein LOC120812818 isoform X2 [Gasterosteus aculeatus]
MCWTHLPFPFPPWSSAPCPMAKCVTCHQEVPLQLLSLHAETCCNNIEEAREADSTSLLDLTDQIVACGYKGPIMDRKDDIVRCIILHGTVKLLPMLQQLSSGLELYGLRPMVQANRVMCRELFVPVPLNVVDADFLIRSLAPTFSDAGTMRRQRELKLVNYLQDLMNEFEDKEEDRGITVSRFCQWVTRQGHKPLDIDQEFKIGIEFEHDCTTRHGSHTICFPIVNACAQTITLPVEHMGSYTNFKNVMCHAINHGFEFSRS